MIGVNDGCEFIIRDMGIWAYQHAAKPDFLCPQAIVFLVNQSHFDLLFVQLPDVIVRLT